MVRLRSLSLGLVASLVLMTAAPGSLRAQEGRRQVRTPGLVVETGARRGACDELLFTRDGNTLLAAGDDKVVRSWPVGSAGFTRHRSRNLRWPIYQAQRGSIYALALSPDERYAAVAGWGIFTGLVAILDRNTGELAHVLSDTYELANWKVAFAPSGKQLVFGADDGSLFRWDFATGAVKAVRIKGPSENTPCLTRLLNFLDGQRFLAVDQEGKVWLGHLRGSVKEIATLRGTEDLRVDVYRAALSPDQRWLAVTARTASDVEDRKVSRQAFADVLLKVAVYPLAVSETGVKLGKRRLLAVPQSNPTENHHPHTLAFDPEGKQLAVGVRVMPKSLKFFKEVGGLVHVFSWPSPERAEPVATFDLGYRPEEIAFRPGVRSHVATAGGNNHEVRLWDVSGKGRLLDTIQSPGSCLWAVALSRDGRYLAFKDRRKRNPANPNDWGDGDWRVLNLVDKAQARGPEPDRPAPRKLSPAPRDLDPVLPLATVDGWKVVPTVSPAVWKVVDGGGNETLLDRASGLYDVISGYPRCYTFIPAAPGKPVRLVVGHMWGVTVYECKDGKVRLDRMLIGHEGEVMAVGPSADGKMLVSASRDQTVAAWSLEDWPSQPVLGASFEPKAGKVAVRQVDPGSPAWELGLQEGDLVTVCVVPEEKFVYNASGKRLTALPSPIYVEEPERPATIVETVEQLKKTQSGREMIFYWQTKDGDGWKPRSGKLKVFQRPLWRMFPIREDGKAGNPGKEFVLWRWQDFYYDTNSARADDYLGWHLNTGNGLGTPEFLVLERFREKFNRPDKIWPVITKSFQNPDRVVFANIEPPQVELYVELEDRLTTGPVDVVDQDVQLRLTVRPRNGEDDQALKSVALWLDDYRYDSDKLHKIGKDGAVNATLTIPASLLRRGLNTITLRGVNKAGGREQAVARVRYDSKKPVAKGDLVGLCVGVTDYRKVRRNGLRFEDLRCSERDAEAIARLLGEHKKSGLFNDARVKLLTGSRVTAEAIRAHLKGLADADLKREDWLVLFISGHGYTARDAVGAYVPDSFAYVCSDASPRDPKTLLRINDLADDLARLPCRKLILFDACHSGDAASNPLRALTANGIPLLVFSSCQPDELAHEPVNEEHGKYGLFTEALLRSLNGLDPSKASRTVPVTGDELARDIATWLQKRLRELDPTARQTPVFYPETLLRLPLFCRPER